MNKFSYIIVAFVYMVPWTFAFAPLHHPVVTSSLSSSSSSSSSILKLSPQSNDVDHNTHITSKLTSSAFVSVGVAYLLHPLVAIAAETQGENYEYGAVNAPPIIPIVGGLVAILTALVPVLFKGGEKAFEEIKERDAETFGRSNKALDRKK